MGKNHMKEIAEMFDVEFGQKFRLKKKLSEARITEVGLEGKNFYGNWVASDKELADLLRGDDEITVKLPLASEHYYVVTFRLSQPFFQECEIIVLAADKDEAVKKAVGSVSAEAFMDRQPDLVYADRAMYCKHCDKGWKIKDEKGYKFCPDCGCRLSEGEE